MNKLKNIFKKKKKGIVIKPVQNEKINSLKMIKKYEKFMEQTLAWGLSDKYEMNEKRILNFESFLGGTLNRLKSDLEGTNCKLSGILDSNLPRDKKIWGQFPEQNRENILEGLKKNENWPENKPFITTEDITKIEKTLSAIKDYKNNKK